MDQNYNNWTTETENWLDAISLEDLPLPPKVTEELHNLGILNPELAGMVVGMGEEAIKYFVSMIEFIHQMVAEGQQSDSAGLTENMNDMFAQSWSFVVDLPNNALHLLTGYVLINDPTLQQDPRFVNPATPPPKGMLRYNRPSTMVSNYTRRQIFALNIVKISHLRAAMMTIDLNMLVWTPDMRAQ